MVFACREDIEALVFENTKFNQKMDFKVTHPPYSLTSRLPGYGCPAAQGALDLASDMIDNAPCKN